MKVSFIYPNEKLSGYACELINWCNSNNNIDVKSIIIIDSTNYNTAKRFFSFLKNIFLNFFLFIDHLLSINNKNYKLIKPSSDLDSNKFNFQYFKVNTVFSLKNKDILSYLLNNDIDVLINLSEIDFSNDFKKIINKKIITSSDIIFKPKNNFYWNYIFYNVFHKKDSIEFQILEDTIYKKNIIVNGFIQTHPLLSKNKINLLEKKCYYTKQIINQLLIKKNISICQCRTELNYVKSDFSILKFLFYFFQLLKLYFSKIIRKLFGFEQMWGVAYVRNNKDYDFSNAHKLESKSLHFIADPFLFSHKNKTYCFVEEYSYLNKKGFISVYEIFKDKSIYLGKVLEENFHLSFPFVFNYKNNIYMCPESSQNNDIRLYKCNNFPFDWSLEKVLVNNTCAADTMLFEKDSKWWMFTNVDPLNKRENCSELHIFYSDSPISNNWIAHANNPIFIDSEKSRNGGFIIENENFYRVSQNQGYDVYGKSSSIFKIVDLNTSVYNEKLIKKIKPNFFKNLKGTHHASKNYLYIAFDYLKISNKYL